MKILFYLINRFLLRPAAMWLADWSEMAKTMTDEQSALLEECERNLIG